MYAMAMRDSGVTLDNESNIGVGGEATKTEVEMDWIHSKEFPFNAAWGGGVELIVNDLDHDDSGLQSLESSTKHKKSKKGK
jgi:hypothetical protein